jgi:hypothetical protein
MIVAGSKEVKWYKIYGRSGHISRLRDARSPSLQRIHHSTKRITKLDTEVIRAVHKQASNEGATSKCTLTLPLHNLHHGKGRPVRPGVRSSRDKLLVVVKCRRHGSTSAFKHNTTTKPSWETSASRRTISKGKSSVREESGRLTTKVRRGIAVCDYRVRVA